MLWFDIPTERVDHFLRLPWSGEDSEDYVSYSTPGLIEARLRFYGGFANDATSIEGFFSDDYRPLRNGLPSWQKAAKTTEQRCTPSGPLIQ